MRLAGPRADLWELSLVINRKTLIKAAIAVASLFASLPAFAAEPKVVVTLKPIHALVAQVMEGVGSPHLIVDGAASPHTFTLKPSGAKAINEADVFIRVSDTLEPFTNKVVEALPKTVKVISLIAAPGVTVLPQRHGDTFEKHEHHEAGPADHDDDDEKAGAKDGHIWLDPNNAKAIVAYVAKELSAVYPEHAAKLAANAAAATAKLEALTKDIEDQLSPYKGRPFIVFHDATQYFEAHFGLAAAGSVTITPDVQPSAKRLTAVRKKIADLAAVCVFAEPGFQPNLVAAVTEGSHARAGSLDPEGITLTAGPGLYAELIRAMARNMKSCFDAPG
jgi:zinc transport system substrate-binding protein